MAGARRHAAPASARRDARHDPRIRQRLCPIPPVLAQAGPPRHRTVQARLAPARTRRLRGSGGAGQAEGSMTQSRQQDEFSARFIPEPNSGCWLWMGSTDRHGYGRLNHVRAHRISYRAFKGKIPAGMVLDHLCRVKCCVNPDHLEPVPNKTKILRGVSFSAVNAARTAFKNGHPFSGENLHIGPTGRRFCRACWRTRSMAYKARRKECAA